MGFATPIENPKPQRQRPASSLPPAPGEYANQRAHAQGKADGLVRMFANNFVSNLGALNRLLLRAMDFLLEVRD